MLARLMMIRFWVTHNPSFGTPEEVYRDSLCKQGKPLYGVYAKAYCTHTRYTRKNAERVLIKQEPKLRSVGKSPCWEYISQNSKALLMQQAYSADYIIIAAIGKAVKQGQAGAGRG